MAPGMENRPLDMLLFRFRNNIEVTIPYCEIANGDLLEIVNRGGKTKFTEIVVEIDGDREVYPLDAFSLEMEKLLARGKLQGFGIKLAAEEEYHYFDISKRTDK